MFINDNDSGSGNNSLFSNVRVYEGSCNGASVREAMAQLSSKEPILGTENEGIRTIKVSPNPATDLFSLNVGVSAISTQEIRVSIFTVLGQQKYVTSLQEGVNTFSASNLGLGTGVYVIKIQSEGDKDIVQKLIVN